MFVKVGLKLVHLGFPFQTFSIIEVQQWDIIKAKCLCRGYPFRLLAAYNVSKPGI